MTVCVKVFFFSQINSFPFIFSICRWLIWLEESKKCTTVTARCPTSTVFHTKVPPAWLLGIRRDLALLFLNWSIICSCWLISQSRTYYRYESIIPLIILAWLYFVSYLFITHEYWSWYNSHFLKVYNTYIILDGIYAKESSTPCRVSHLQGVWLVWLYNLSFSARSCLVSSL